mmetsp:Transcript_80125/g.158743  ORF Transcript_80125/g.158743 Transcript_80125/m.158743 type:complete len:572 (+) Transcript_80125:77-1792(+)
MQLLFIQLVLAWLLQRSPAQTDVGVSPDKKVHGQPDGWPNERPDRQPVKYAYLTLVSGSKWILPARTLALSMDQVGCRWPRVMLMTYSPTESSKRLLKGEKWDVREVPRIPNPFNDYGEMTRNTFSMLWAYNLTEFSKIIYIDVDFLVLNNIDDLFECGEWCAAQSGREHYGRFNAGLQVLTPNQTLFHDMCLWAGTNRFGSYNRGVQGFLNEAIPFWCSEGRTHDWLQVSWDQMDNPDETKKRYRDCKRLSKNYNHNALVTKNLRGQGGNALPWWLPGRVLDDAYNDEVSALHFNHASYWAVKPWLWIWYPLYPSAWIWWQVRGEVAGQAWARAYLAFVGIAIPVAFSCAVTKWGLPGASTALTLPAATGNLNGRTLQFRCLRCRRYIRSRAVETLAFSVSASVLVAYALPFDADALVAWGCYFTLKGCLLGVFALKFLAAGSMTPPLAWARLGCVIRGYACMSIEVAGIWVLPSAISLAWLSDEYLEPLCNKEGNRNYDTYKNYDTFGGCNNMLWTLVTVDAVLILCLQLLLLRPLWTNDQFLHGGCFRGDRGATSAASIELSDLEKKA